MALSFLEHLIVRGGIELSKTLFNAAKEAWENRDTSNNSSNRRTSNNNAFYHNTNGRIISNLPNIELIGIMDESSNPKARPKYEDLRNKYILKKLNEAHEHLSGLELEEHNIKVSELRKFESFATLSEDNLENLDIKKFISKSRKEFGTNDLGKGFNYEEIKKKAFIYFCTCPGHSEEEYIKAYILINRCTTEDLEHEKRMELLTEALSIIPENVSLRLLIEKEKKYLKEAEYCNSDNINSHSNKASKNTNPKYFEAINLFNAGNYSEALKKITSLIFNDANLDNSEYIIASLIFDNFYNYRAEKILSLALKAFKKNKDYSYLPFLYTLMGDESSKSFFHPSLCVVYYLLAIVELELIPENERFVAPYVKLARYCESVNKYEEALILYKKAKLIDKSYKLANSINRAEAYMRGEGEKYAKEGESYFDKARNAYNKHNCKEAINYCIKGFDYVLISKYNAEYMCSYALEANNFFTLKSAVFEMMRSNGRYSEYLAWCYFYEAKYNEAISILEQELINNEAYNNNYIELYKKCCQATGISKSEVEKRIREFQISYAMS